MNTKAKKLNFISIIVVTSLVGIYLRLYHIEFGLPHSFHADEPEIAELAIKYTYEIRDVIKNNNYYKLIPISFVYGTFPAYLFTSLVMGFSKISNIVGNTFSKQELYVFMRVMNALLSLGIPASIYLLYKHLYKNRMGLILTAVILMTNWKLIVHAHYINADILLTLLLSICFLVAYLYYSHKLDNKHVVLLGLVYGIAVGTKITALLSLPLFLYLFLIKKDYRGLFGFIFLICIGFTITNPFSLILIEDFAFRIYSMKTKEAGMVFDSIDSNPFKYLLALEYMVTPIVFIGSIIEIINSLRSSKNKFHIFLIGNIVVYIFFYSLSSRRVDRWLLPIVPLVLMYGIEGLRKLITKSGKAVQISLGIALFISYMYYPYLLTKQFGKNTPKSSAYIWSQKNLPSLAKKLVITEEGLDPFNKLEGANVVRYKVYEAEQAQLEYPPDKLELYNYVILSSRPMQNFKRKEVVQKYPNYAMAWHNFENSILDNLKFKLIEDFTLPKPNLVDLSDVYIYQRL